MICPAYFITGLKRICSPGRFVVASLIPPRFLRIDWDSASPAILGQGGSAVWGRAMATSKIELAGRLRAAGRREFTIDCVDLNTTMRDRAVEAAAQAGVAEHLRFIAADLNHWHPADEYDAVIANQSLHHILNLEGLFDDIKKTLRPDGAFLISDMIGRNGHLRWPEAMAIIQEYWKALPPSYRVNRRLGRYEHEFQDWDCSTEGFEGVRAQDILPLLVDRFEFHLFFPFGNLIDPFIDRTFGPQLRPFATFRPRVHRSGTVSRCIRTRGRQSETDPPDRRRRNRSRGFAGVRRRTYARGSA